MNHPQESRINQQMDSQVKRTLQRAIDYEQIKKSLGLMLDQIAAEEGWTASPEFCEEYIAACKVLGRSCYDAQVWLEENQNQK